MMQTLFRILFPVSYRSFWGKRWIHILLRTAHLVGAAGLCGGFLFGAPKEAWLPYLALTSGSGVLLMLLEVWTNGVWLIHLCGIAVVVKLVLLSFLPVFEPYQVYVLLGMIVLSGVMSHAPRGVRHYSVFHRRQIDVLQERRR